MVGEMRLFRLVSVLVLVAIVVLPVSMALADEYNAYPTRTLPATVERGETFNVTVTFIPAGDDFHAVSLTDLAPDDWNVTVARDWCWPLPSIYNANGNKADFGWMDSYTENFTVLYKVTVPCDANLTNYSFGAGFVGYFVGYSGHIFEDVEGDFNVTVVPPAILPVPASMGFYGAFNGTNPSNQTLHLFSSTPCTLNWSLTDDADWLEAYPTNGSCTDVGYNVTVSVNTSGMPVGNHTANITIQSPEASNSPRLVPVILHIRLTGILQGQVNFTGRGDPGTDRWVESFEVKLFEPGNLDNVLWAGNSTTNNTGVFTIPDVVAAAYDIGIKNWTSLSVLKTNVTVPAGVITPVDFGTPREGDANNDDYIVGGDFGLFSIAYDSWPGQPNWDPRCDFDRDDYIGGTDFGLSSINYDKWGEAYGYF